jgi:hypothetical protein
VAFGAALPAAFGPLISLTGDAYEIGSLAVVHLPLWSGRRVLVGDDLAAKVAEIVALREPVLLAGLCVAALAGLVWALCWTLLARGLATRLGEPPLEARNAASPRPTG